MLLIMMLFYGRRKKIYEACMYLMLLFGCPELSGNGQTADGYHSCATFAHAV